MWLVHVQRAGGVQHTLDFEGCVQNDVNYVINFYDHTLK